MVTGAAPLLEMRGIDKSFPGVHALRAVDLTLVRGEVLALLGENGAGKSTLIKMLGGAHQPDAGSIRIDGAEVQLEQPADASRVGIGVIYQEFNLVPALTAWENIFLGHEASFGFVRRIDERRRAKELFQRIDVDVPVDTPCGRLSVAQQQIVEIAKALSQDVRLLVMDEPSATLTPQEVDRLFDVIRDLRTHGIGVIYISHRLDEIFEIADRVMVLRDGQNVGDATVDQMTCGHLIEMMVGRKIENEFPKHHHEVGEPRLIVTDLRQGDAVQGVSFDVRRGEVLGMTGLVGAGRTEVVRLIFGADRAESGSIELDGVRLRIREPRDAVRAGICLLTEDRKSQGLVLGGSVRENFGLPNLSELSRCGFVRQRQERQDLAQYVDSLQIKIPHQEQLARNLSGGNQQKVVLAKWLQRKAEVVIFDEPTRGIDVGAKYEVYMLINELARQGKAIIMISSELPEVLGMSDRILVMHEGRVTGVIEDVQTATQQQIMELAVGVITGMTNNDKSHSLAVRFVSDYGMIFVLLLLAALFSSLTIKQQHPTGTDAGRQVADLIVKKHGTSAKVLVVTRDTAEDRQFAAAAAQHLQKAGATVLANVNGAPADVRKAIESILADGQTIDAIAANDVTAKWTVYDKYPTVGSAKCMTPSPYYWPDFLKMTNLLGVANQTAIYAIIAIGMTMVIITAGIDLSVGSLVALASVCSALTVRDWGGGVDAGTGMVAVACLVGILVCAAAGAFNGLMVTAFRIPPFIVTLGMMMMASGLAFRLADGRSIPELPATFFWLGGRQTLGIPNPVLLMLVLYIVAHIVMSRMVFGRYVYAIGGNEEAARLSGVPVKRVLLAVYTICGALAGLGGVVLTSQLAAGDPKFGLMYELEVIAAVVVGGTSLMGGEGKIFGTLIGAFIIAVIKNGMNLTNVDPFNQKIVLGAVLLAAVLIDTLKRRQSAS